MTEQHDYVVTFQAVAEAQVLVRSTSREEAISAASHGLGKLLSLNYERVHPHTEYEIEECAKRVADLLRLIASVESDITEARKSTQDETSRTKSAVSIYDKVEAISALAASAGFADADNAMLDSRIHATATRVLVELLGVDPEQVQIEHR